MSSKAKINFALDVVIAAAFIFSALSGIILLLLPGGYQGGRNPNFQGEFLFLEPYTWKALHTWTSLIMVAAVIIHLALHWKWIVCMVKKSLGWEHKSRSSMLKQASDSVCTVAVEAKS